MKRSLSPSLLFLSSPHKQHIPAIGSARFLHGRWYLLSNQFAYIKQHRITVALICGCERSELISFKCCQMPLPVRPVSMLTNFHFIHTLQWNANEACYFTCGNVIAVGSGEDKEVKPQPTHSEPCQLPLKVQHSTTTNSDPGRDPLLGHVVRMSSQ